MRNSFVKFSGKENACPSKETIAEMRAKFRQQPLSIDMPFNPLVNQTAGFHSSKNAYGSAKPELPTTSISTKASKSRYFAQYISSSKLVDCPVLLGPINNSADGAPIGRSGGLKNTVSNSGDQGGQMKSSDKSLTDVFKGARFTKSSKYELRSNQTLVASPVHQILKSNSFTLPPKYAVNFSEIGGPRTSQKFERRVSKNFERKTESQIDFDSLDCSLGKRNDSQDNPNAVKETGTPSKAKAVSRSPVYDTPDFPMRHKYVIESFGKKLDGLFESMQADTGSDCNSLNKNQLAAFLRLMGVEEDETLPSQQALDSEKDALLKILMHGLKTESEEEISYPILRIFLTTVHALQRQKVWDKLNLNSEGRTYNSPQSKSRGSISQFSGKLYSFSKNTAIPNNPSLFQRIESQKGAIVISTEKNTEKVFALGIDAIDENQSLKETIMQSSVHKPSWPIQQCPILYSEKPAFSLQHLPTLDLYSSYAEGQNPPESSTKLTNSLSNNTAYRFWRQQKLLHKNQKNGLYIDGDANSQKSLPRESRFQMSNSLLVYDVPEDSVSVESSFDKGQNKPLYITKICRALCEFHESKARTSESQERGEYLYCVVMKFTDGRKHLSVHANDSPQKLIDSFLQKYNLDKSSRAHLQCFLVNDPKARARS